MDVEKCSSWELVVVQVCGGGEREEAGGGSLSMRKGWGEAGG